MRNGSINYSPRCNQPCHWYDQEHRKILNGFTDTLNSLAVGIILVNNAGHVIYINEVAKRTTNKKTSLKVSENGLISASYPSETAELKKLIVHAITCPTKEINHISLRNITSTMVLVIGVQHLQVCDVPNVPCAAIYVVDQENHTTAPSHVFQGLYGLTRREAELALALAKGMRVAEYANYRNISLNTVNTQLKSIMGKTSTSRQADLIRLIVTSFPVFSSVTNNA